MYRVRILCIEILFFVRCKQQEANEGTKMVCSLPRERTVTKMEVVVGSSFCKWVLSLSASRKGRKKRLESWFVRPPKSALTLNSLSLGKSFFAKKSILKWTREIQRICRLLFLYAHQMSVKDKQNLYLFCLAAFWLPLMHERLRPRKRPKKKSDSRSASLKCEEKRKRKSQKSPLNATKRKRSWENKLENFHQVDLRRGKISFSFCASRTRSLVCGIINIRLWRSKSRLSLWSEWAFLALLRSDRFHWKALNEGRQILQRHFVADKLTHSFALCAKVKKLFL